MKKLALVLALSALPVAGALYARGPEPAGTAPAGAAGSGCGEFTIAMIPDTQNYLDYGHQKSAGYPVDGTELFFDQMRYVAAHAKSAGGDIVFATQVGDVWQHYSAWMDPAHEARGFRGMPNALSSEVAEGPRKQTRAFEIPNAVKGFRMIAGKLPFAVVPGNHDYDALWTDPAHPPQPERTDGLKIGLRHLGGLSGFQSAFSDQSEFFKGQPWYVDSHDNGADSAQIFTAGKCRFLHIGLQFDAPDASLAWATRVIHRFPGVPTIVTTHKYLDRDGARPDTPELDQSILDSRDNNPQMVWDEFISQNDQIFLVLSGHIGGQGYSIDRNLYGHVVHQMMADYQGRWQVAKDMGWKDAHATLGDGWLRLLTFRLDGANPRVQVRTWSTFYKKFSTELPDYADWYKAHDGMAKLSDADYSKRDDFSFDLGDFRARFGVTPGAGKTSAR